MKTTIRISLLACGAASLAACVDAPPDQLAGNRDPYSKPYVEDPTKPIPDRPGAYAGGAKNTFDHMADLGANGARDPFDILAERQEEGPPEIRTRLHSCQKLQNAALSNVLTSFGVDMGAVTDPPSAGQLFKTGTGALGAANYDARIGEAITWTAAGAAKLFDVFVQAAPEIIANMSKAPQCQLDGAGVEMFDADSQCNPDAITCLIGRPATPDHVAICDALVEQASDVDKGKAIAVATLLSAAHSCE